MISEKNLITIKLSSSRMKFSSGHFTIFSESHRETIHGHNFSVECVISGFVNDNGIIIDYGIIKKEISIICQDIDEKMLLPEKSKYLRIKKTKINVLCYFNGEKMSFPSRDVCILPISNITIEALAEWFLTSLVSVRTLIGPPNRTLIGPL